MIETDWETAMKRFKEVAKVGEGSFGVVVKAVDTLNGEVVALKKVALKHYHYGNYNFYGEERSRKESDLDEENRSNLKIDVHSIPNHILREIKALQQLVDHPNIIGLHQIFPQQGGGPGLVMVCSENFS